MINEDKIIASLQKHSNGFIGDDAAVMPAISDEHYVVAKDLLIENIHFRIDYFEPSNLAHKALHVNLSDIAAMGVTPLYILCGISIPDHLHDYGQNFLDSLNLSCQEVDITLIGGDMTSSEQHLFISITAIGMASATNIKYRSGARSGDLICVIGNLGFAHLGFLGLEHSKKVDKQYINSFLCPNARIKEGIWLGNQPDVTSMMDISDGLYIDLKRLALSSKKHAAIDLDILQTHLTSDISVQMALEGGEDYGLLVTINEDVLEELSHSFIAEFGYDLKIIGHIIEGNGVSFKQDNRSTKISVNHFTHFGKKL